MAKLNRYQQAVANAYADGEYSYITAKTVERLIRPVPAEWVDTLFRFLMAELDDVENLDEAHQRVAAAIADLQDAARALDELETEALKPNSQHLPI